MESNPSAHFQLLEISLERRLITSYCSLGWEMRGIREASRDLLCRCLRLDGQGWKDGAGHCPRQVDGIHCGYFALMIARLIGAGRGQEVGSMTAASVHSYARQVREELSRRALQPLPLLTSEEAATTWMGGATSPCHSPTKDCQMFGQDTRQVDPSRQTQVERPQWRPLIEPITVPDVDDYVSLLQRHFPATTFFGPSSWACRFIGSGPEIAGTPADEERITVVDRSAMLVVFHPGHSDEPLAVEIGNSLGHYQLFEADFELRAVTGYCSFHWSMVEAFHRFLAAMQMSWPGAGSEWTYRVGNCPLQRDAETCGFRSLLCARLIAEEREGEIEGIEEAAVFEFAQQVDLELSGDILVQLPGPHGSATQPREAAQPRMNLSEARSSAQLRLAGEAGTMSRPPFRSRSLAQAGGPDPDVHSPEEPHDTDSETASESVSSDGDSSYIPSGSEDDDSSDCPCPMDEQPSGEDTKEHIRLISSARRAQLQPVRGLEPQPAGIASIDCSDSEMAEEEVESIASEGPGDEGTGTAGSGSPAGSVVTSEDGSAFEPSDPEPDAEVDNPGLRSGGEELTGGVDTEDHIRLIFTPNHHSTKPAVRLVRPIFIPVALTLFNADGPGQPVHPCPDGSSEPRAKALGGRRGSIFDRLHIWVLAI